MMYTRFLFGAILMLIAMTASAQRGAVRGRVVDAKTLEPLPYANVYFNFTSIGTSTDANGEFTLTVQPGTHELVISFVGYKSYQGKITIFDNYTSELSIRLAATTLSEITVKSTRDRQWKVQLEKFKRTFFGKGEYTEQCTILNTWVLDFKEDSEGVFTAWANSPLYIENMALGYKLFYQLNRFSVGPALFTISGTVRFQQMQSADTAVIHLWHRNRESAYRGSTRHLFKSILDNKAREEGFEIYEDISQQVEITRSSAFLSNINKHIKEFDPGKNVASETSKSEYKLKLPSRIEVHYKNKTAPATIYHSVAHPISWIEVKNTLPIVNQQGILINQGSVTVLGALSDSRIASILPYDYTPLPYTPRPAFGNKSKAWGSLVEKPYVHTDKSYYYPGETIWLKAYMNYHAPAMKDSLSRVLFVDVVNSSQDIITTKIFAIENGMVAASLTLPKALAKGDYQLRAFTRWMHNFNSSFTFVRPFRVMEDLESVVLPKEFSTPAVSPELKISTGREEYRLRDKIEISLELRDFYEFPEAGELSVSVTDLQQAVPPLNDLTILHGFPIPESSLPDTLVFNKLYSIQTGIDLSGKFIGAKKKFSQGKLTIAQQNSDDMFIIATEKNGEFNFPGLMLFDSTALYYQAQTVKRKLAGQVIWDSLRISPLYSPTDPLQLPVEKNNDALRAHLFDEPEALPARMLEEVTVEAPRQRQEIKTGASHLSADITVDGDWMVESNSYDVLQSLRRKVPGMQIHYVIENGLPRKYLLFGISTFSAGTSQEPLLLIDGVPIPTTGGDLSVAERISSMSPYEIERIDVLKSGLAAAYGARGGNGVIAIYTRNKPPQTKVPALDKSKMKPVGVAGFSSFKKFTPVDYAQANDPAKKDYRSLIYWNPQVHLDGKKPAALTFYAADLPTTYRIVVEGVTASGKPVRAEKLIAIAKAP